MQLWIKEWLRVFCIQFLECKGNSTEWAFQGVLVVKNPPANAGDIRDLGQENLLEDGMATHSSFSCLENPMGRRSWWATVHRVTKSWTGLGNYTRTHMRSASHRLFQFPSCHRDQRHSQLYKTHQSSQALRCSITDLHLLIFTPLCHIVSRLVCVTNIWQKWWYVISIVRL